MKKFQKSRSINKKKNTFQSSSVSDNIKYSSNLIGPTLSTTSKSIISQNYIKFSSLSPKPLNKKGKNYLYDTKKTFSLNLEIIKNYISQTTTINTLLNKDKEILTLYAKWEHIQYSVSVDSSGTSGDDRLYVQIGSKKFTSLSSTGS